MLDAFSISILLAQANSSSNPTQKIWILLIAIVIIAVVVALFAGWVRHKAMMEPGPSIGFTLSDLRQMREEGQLSAEEFETAKAKILARTKESLLTEDEEIQPSTKNLNSPQNETADPLQPPAPDQDPWQDPWDQ